MVTMETHRYSPQPMAIAWLSTLSRLQDFSTLHFLVPRSDAPPNAIIRHLRSHVGGVVQQECCIERRDQRRNGDLGHLTRARRNIYSLDKWRRRLVENRPNEILVNHDTHARRQARLDHISSVFLV